MTDVKTLATQAKRQRIFKRAGKPTAKNKHPIYIKEWREWIYIVGRLSKETKEIHTSRDIKTKETLNIAVMKNGLRIANRSAKQTKQTRKN